MSPHQGILTKTGYNKFFNWLGYSRTELPHMCDILKELPKPMNPNRTVYVIHMPPAGLRLGWLGQEDLDIGSVDIHEFLEEKQQL